MTASSSSSSPKRRQSAEWHFNAALERALSDRELERQARWTEAVAVGERTFVEAIDEQIHCRQPMTVQEHGGSWVLRESA
jgi:hypothetical protein